MRLLGLYASGLLERSDNQMQLSFGLEARPSDAKSRRRYRSREHQAERGALRDAIDEVRRRFGRTSVGTASELGERGSTWSPSADVTPLVPRRTLGVNGDERADRRVGKDRLAEAKGISTQPRLWGKP